MSETQNQYDLSIVISSFNRDNIVAETVKCIYDSDLELFQRIELVIIDDGSPRPVKDALAKIPQTPPKIDLKILTQKNSGIGATRNRGFREASASLILFLDDDILIEKHLLSEIHATQKQQPMGLFFGGCPFVSYENESLHRFADVLFGFSQMTSSPKFEQVNAIASGLLVANKPLLNGLEKLYQDDLTIPAAEEYEAIYRFDQLKIPIFYAKHISAIHNHHLKLDWLVWQQYKYGLGTAEVFCKYLKITELESFSQLKQKLDGTGKAGVKNWLKFWLSHSFSRKVFLFWAKVLGNIYPTGNHNFTYEILVSSYYWAGYLAGKKRFSSSRK